MNGNVVAVIQARLGSSRLPLKSLLSLRGLPVIDWVVRRVARSRLISGLIVAIPDTELDQVLAGHLERNAITCLLGPENDVLARFTLAARATHADFIIRICADNPLVSGEAIDRLIGFYGENECDYAYNHIPRGNLWPDGLGAEIVSADLLYRIDRLARLPAQREHCLNYLWDNVEDFSIRTFNPAETWLCRPDLKLDMDSVEDFRRLASLPLEPDMNLLQLMTACQQPR